jgi:pseudoazurin
LPRAIKRQFALEQRAPATVPVNRSGTWPTALKTSGVRRCAKYCYWRPRRCWRSWPEALLPGHNEESIKGVLPAGATPFVGKNGEDVAMAFDKAGIYGVKCLPHYGMGMVAMVVVGTPASVEEARAVPQVGKAKQVMAGLFERLAAQTAQK